MRWFHAVIAILLTASPAAILAQTHPEILYAESFAPVAVTTGRTEKLSRSQRMNVRAFGRQFQLVLEDNSRLTSRLVETSVAGLRVLKGSIEGVDGSWVRLTVNAGRYEGVMWDGSELYAVQPSDSLPSTEQIPSGASTIFRSSDVRPKSIPPTCGNDDNRAAASYLGRYKAVIGELRAIAALNATKDVEVAMLADFEYSATFGRGAMEAMISRMNVVDGIFATQLDVNIIPTDFTAFTNIDDPFTSSDAATLLEQVASYRNATPTIRNRALTHLLTGRDLDGSIIGIAYIDALCDSESGAAVSEAGGYSLDSALIIAHELGHNFGAQHDGVAGTACSTTPQTFLMAPEMNGSSTFSSCSVQSMQASVAGASCVSTAHLRDVAISAPATQISAALNQAFDYVVDVTSTGDSPAHNISTTIEFGSDLQVRSALMPDATCSIDSGTVNCQLLTLEAGQQRRLTVSIFPTAVGARTSRATVLASNDGSAANNTIEVPIQVDILQDAAITMTPATQSVAVGSSFEVLVTLLGTGTQPLLDPVARISTGSLQVTSATSDSGPCSLVAGAWICDLSSLAPQESRTIRLQLTAPSYVGQNNVSVELASDHPRRVISTAYSGISTIPRYDIRIVSTVSRRIVAIGQPAEFPVTIASVGAQPVPGARMTIRGAANVTLEFTSSGSVACTPSGFNLDCDLGTMTPGSTISGQLRAVASVAISTYIDFDIPQSVPDDYRTNNHFLLTLDARPGSDVSVPYTSSESYGLRDGVKVPGGFVIWSTGATPPVNVRATVALPASFVIYSASLAGGTCAVADSVATCELATLTTDNARIDVTYAATEPGDYTGKFEVTASNDAVPSNNARDLKFAVRPNVDARLVIPSLKYGMLNEPLDLHFEVVNNRYVMADSRLLFEINTNVIVETISTPSGTCTQTGYRIECALGTLAPSSTTGVDLRARVATGSFLNMQATFSSPYDMDMLNNGAQTFVTIDAPGDISLATAETASATVNQPLTLPDISVTTLASVHQPFIELDFDPAQVAQPAVVANAFNCSWDTRPVRCAIPSASTGTMVIRFSLVPNNVGSFPIILRVGGRNDTNAANNERQITVNVQAAPGPSSPAPPTPTPAPTPQSKGGGGGAMELSLLTWLVAARVALLRRRWRRSTATSQ